MGGGGPSASTPSGSCVQISCIAIPSLSKNQLCFCSLFIFLGQLTVPESHILPGYRSGGGDVSGEFLNVQGGKELCKGAANKAQNIVEILWQGLPQKEAVLSTPSSLVFACPGRSPVILIRGYCTRTLAGIEVASRSSSSFPRQQVGFWILTISR